MPRFVLVSILLVCLLLAACGGDDVPTQTPIVIVVTATPMPATSTPLPPTSTETAEPSATAVATSTPPPPTETPEPAATLAPVGFGGTIELAGWTISLARMEHRGFLAVQDSKLACNSYVLLWIDARNNGDVAASLDRDFQWAIVAESGQSLHNLTDTQGGSEPMPWIKEAGRDLLSKPVAPAEVTHALVGFPVAGNPPRLTITSKKAGQSYFDLNTGDNPGKDVAPAACPTATPLATSTPPPGFGATLQYNNWSISLAKLDSSKNLDWSDYYHLIASGKFWYVYVDFKNLSGVRRSVSDSFKFTVIDDHGDTNDEMSQATYQTYEFGQYAQRRGRDPLDIGIAARSTAHPILVFDIAADAVPKRLRLKSTGYGEADYMEFNLSK